MYKRLLVAIGGADRAEAILPYALGITQAAGMQLSLVRIVEADGERAKASVYVDALAAKLNAKAHCVSADGDVAAALIAEAGREPDTLIAMTTHGRSGVLGAALGSVAMNVLRAAGHAPALIYRSSDHAGGDPAAAIKITRVVVPMDGTRAQASAADAPAGDLSESSYVRTRATELGKKHGVDYSWEVLHGDETDKAIADFVGKDRGTMLAMVTRANSAPVAAAFLGSVATGCLRKAAVPILMRLP